jgi:hypothetical protein
LLKTQGSEICSECWSNVNYQNFDTTNFTKPIGEKCPHCEQKQGTQIKPNNCINCQKVISQEPTEHLCSNCKSSESNPVDTPKTSSQSTSNSNHYTSPPTTNPTSTLTNCCECHKAIAVGEQVYT